jgi:hypothetical protein
VTDTQRSTRRSPSVVAVLGILVVIGIAIALPLQGSTYAAVVGYVVLLTCALGVLVWLYAAVRRGFRVYRGEPLRAASRDLERSDILPAELRRIQSDVARAQESAEEYGKFLEPRLQRLAERRARLTGGRIVPSDLVTQEVDPKTGSRRRPARRGLTVGEIDRIVRTIEEM